MDSHRLEAYMEAQTELLRLIALMMAETLRRSSKLSRDFTADAYDEGIANITSNLKRTLQEHQGTEQ